MDMREREIRRRLKTDFLHYADKCLKIRAKDGRILPLRLNAAQRYIHERIEAQRCDKGFVRAIILKGRQQGCTTYVQARYYWRLSHERGLRAFTLTHLDDASRNVHQMMRRFHENCPVPVRPHTGLINARELTFDRMDSSYQVGTAKSSGVGRAQTIQLFHGSEVAYWSDAEDHVAGILQAVTQGAGSEVILESTSCGAQGLFHELAQAALRGDSEYLFIFVPWFLQPEYKKDIGSDFALTADEEDYRQQHQLDLPQMAWRRQKMDELGGLWTFRREYPATPDEAFAADRRGALWTRALLHGQRRHVDHLPEFKRIVVAIDPATRSGAGHDETGIIIAALGVDDHGYVLEDLSGRYTPSEWASHAIAAYYRHKADLIVAETNQGGDMVEYTLRSFDKNLPFKSLHASRGKVTRAEPIAALDARGMVHHVGLLPVLEDQMCQFVLGVQKNSPDRVDARVWALTELMLHQRPASSPMIWGG